MLLCLLERCPRISQRQRAPKEKVKERSHMALLVLLMGGGGVAKTLQTTLSASTKSSCKVQLANAGSGMGLTICDCIDASACWLMNLIFSSKCMRRITTQLLLQIILPFSFQGLCLLPVYLLQLSYGGSDLECCSQLQFTCSNYDMSRYLVPWYFSYDHGTTIPW